MTRFLSSTCDRVDFPCQVAQMLEATYNSVHSSFRAVLSVADNLVRLRTQLVKILRSFMMFGIGHRYVTMVTGT